MGRLSSKSYINLHALFQFALTVYLTRYQEVIADCDLSYNVNDVIRIDATPTFAQPRSPFAYCGVTLLAFALFDLILATRLPLINQLISVMSRLFNARRTHNSAPPSSPTSSTADKMLQTYTSLFTHICILLAITRCLVFSVISIRIYASASEVWVPAAAATAGGRGGMPDAAALDAKVAHIKNKVVLGYAVAEMMISASTLLSLKDERLQTRPALLFGPLIPSRFLQ
ncbi:Ilm1 superfamily domain-containing protein [Histoplasma ohiense]|nr:Ilm1 superfamily domain-containing protein [Histoplasma ohiense (nom. inval.)]